MISAAKNFLIYTYLESHKFFYTYITNKPTLSNNKYMLFDCNFSLARFCCVKLIHHAFVMQVVCCERKMDKRVGGDWHVNLQH